MRFQPRSLQPLALLVGLALGACTVSDKSQNAYDPSTPPTQEATATLTGTVTVEPPETGPADASGVLVSLEGANVTARTGPGGTFQLVAVPPGTYILNLSKANYETVRTAPIQVPLWYSTEPSVNLGTFLLSLARGSIGGTALLEGEPTADGISVSVAGTAHVTTTNATGQYVLNQVPIGTYTVTFHKAAFVDQSLTSIAVVDQATTTNPTVTLAANPGSITGNVVLSGSATNAGVTILVSGTTLDGNPSTANGSTDATGAFQITAVPAGVYQVSFQATGYATQQVSTAVAPALPSTLGTITLAQATGQIAGTVTLDDDTDSSGTTVLLYATVGGNTLDGGPGDAGGADGGAPAGAPVASAVTLMDGTYTLSAVPVGSYAVAYSHTGYAPVTLSGLSVVANQITTPPTTILTSKPATILGQVSLEGLAAGADLSGTQISIPGTSVQGTTATDGTFELDGVSTGQHDVELTRAGYVPQTILVTTTPGEVVTIPPQTLLVARGSVGGTILAEGATNSSGILVTLAGGVAGDSYSAVTDPTGAFLIQNVRVGTYTLLASLAGYQPYTSPPFQVVLLQTSSYASTPAVLAANPGSISGYALLPASATSAGVTILVSGTTLAGNPATATGTTDSTGAFQITGVPAGIYQVQFQATGYATQQVSAAVAAGTPSDLGTITLAQATGSIFGTVTLDDTTDSSGTTVLLYGAVGGTTGLDAGPADAGVSDAGAADDAGDGGTPADGGAASATPIASAVTLQDGTYTLTNVPVGTYSLSYSHGGYAPVTLTGISVTANTVTTPPNTVLTSQPASILGQVLLDGAAAGADLSGTSVSIPGTSIQGTTAADGTFELDGIGSGQQDVQISRAGYVGVTLLVSTTPGEVVTIPPQTLLVARGAVGGTIFAAGRTDNSGILVTLAGGVPGDSYSAVTDSSGDFLIQSVRVGTYTLIASLAGYQGYTSPSFQVVDGETAAYAPTTATLQLWNAGSVVGVVLADGAPVQSGTSVLLSGADLNGAAISGSALTQLDGSYEIGTLPEGSYSVTFTRAGYTSVALQPTAVGAGLQVTLPTLTLERAMGAYAGSVTVTAGATGMTITQADSAGASVAVTDPSLVSSYTAATDSNGNYTIAAIPAPLQPTTAYTLTASKPNYTPATTTAILSAGSAPTTVPGMTLAAAGFTLSGCVIVPPPVADSSGVSVSLTGVAFNGTTYTNAGNGASTVPTGGCGGSPTGATYSFSNVPDGTYTISLNETGYGADTLTGITVSGGNISLPLATLGRATGTITGTVTASNSGTGLAVDASSALIQVSGAGLTSPIQGSTDPSGTYTISGIPVNPAGTPYTISASKPNYVAAGTTTATPAAGTTVTASSTITLNVAVSTVTGTVIVPQPPAANSAGVSATLSGVAFNGASFAPATAATSTAAGAYTFTSDVPPGIYSVTLTLSGYSPTTIPGVVVTAGNSATVSTTTLTRATGTITGTVVASAGTTGLTADPSSVLVQVTGTGLTAPATGVTDSTGAYTITGVPVNPSGTPYTVTASKANYVAAGTTTATPVANVTVNASGTITLNVATSTVSGTVTVPAPAANSAGVTATIAGQAFNGAAYAPTTTAVSNSSGAYAFGFGVPPGTYTVTLSLFGYTPATINGVTVVAGSNTTVPAATLGQATGTVTGTVTASAGTTGIGVDASNVLISITGAGLTTPVTGTTTPAGTYSISGVPVNPSGTPYTVTASKQNYVAAGTTTATPVANASVAAAGTLALTVATSPVSGTVSVPSPAPSSAGVVATISGIAFNGSAYGPISAPASVAAGTYSFGSIVPPGSYSVTLSLFAYNSATVPNITVVAGNSTTVPLTTLTQASGTITGTVTTSASGTGITTDPGSVLITISGSGLSTPVTGTTSPSGAYSIAGVPVSPAGTPYTITATKTDYVATGTATATPLANTTVNASATITLDVATTTVSGTALLPSPATSSAGVVASISGFAFNGSSYGPVSAAPSASAGTYSFGAVVPPGTYSVTLTLAAYNPVTVPGVNVVAGLTTTVPTTTLSSATGTITGTVTASAGSTGIAVDASNVLITITGAWLTAPVTGTTTPAGTYSISGVPVNPAGTPYTITATKSNYVASGTTTATPVANASVAAAGTITMNVATTTVSGTVLLPSPAISSAGVVASISGLAFDGASYGPVSASPSSSTGAYSFGATVPPGTYSVTLTLAAYNPATVSGVNVVAGATTTVPTTTLSGATGTVTGTVTASAGSTGIAVDASSVLITVTGAWLTAPVTGTTTPAGTYSITGVPVNPSGTPYTITATKLNYVASGTTTATPVANTSVAAAGTITMSVATSTVSGTVTVPPPAANSAGVTASVSGIAFNGSSFGPVSASPSAAAGTYSFGSTVPPGTYTVSLALTGYTTATVSNVSVVAGSATTVPTTTLGRASGTVTGSVVASANGTGISVSPSSALISITGTGLTSAVTGTTDQNGNYSISVPVNPSGTPYTVAASLPNYVATGTTTATPVANTSVAASGTITLSVATGTVSGTVTVPQPPAANSAGVSATISGVAFNGSSYAPSTPATSAAAGTYSFGNTVPPGTYSVTLSLAGYAPVTISGVNVTAGNTTTLAGTTLARATGTVYGTITLSANGTGLTLAPTDNASASVTISGTNLTATGATTDTNGNWTVASVPVGAPAGTTYTATVSKEGYTSSSVSSIAVTANTSTQVSGLTLNVTPYPVGGSITLQGQAAGSYGGVSAALSGVAFNGVPYSTAPVLTGSSGAFSIANVPAGTYSITLTGSTSYQPLIISPVIVGSGSSATSLTGTLLRASGTFTGTVAVSNGVTGLTLSATDQVGFTVVVSDASFGGATYSGITGGAGAFSIAGIPAPLTPSATYLITASKAGFTNATTNVVLNPTLSATAAGTLTATVTPNPLTAYAIVVSPATTPTGTMATISGVAFDGTAFSAGSTTAVTDGTNLLQEDFTFTSLPMSSGTYTLTFTNPAFTSVTTSVSIPVPVPSTPPTVTFSTRTTGSVSGTVAVSGGSTGLIPSATDKQGILVTMIVNGTSLTTTTDSNGSFTFTNVPTTISGTYSVNVSKGSNWLAGPAAQVTVSTGNTSTASGLTLTVNPGSLPGVVQLHDFENNGNPATYTAVPVSLSGTTFNGLAWGPVTQTSSGSNGVVNFGNLPPGSYSITAVLAQHTSATASGIAVPPGGAATTTTLTLTDTAAPTTPVITASTASPTSATSTSVTIVSPSSDPTLPTQNFDNYVVSVHSVPNPGGGAGTTVQVSSSWSGASGIAVPLVVGDDNYISVYGVDYDGNQSTAAQLVIHCENRAPTAPTNIHVDNQPAAIRVTWTAPTGYTSSLPIGGYKIYYGPQLSTVGSSYTGTAASEGPSPIVVGDVTEFNLTGLSNNNAFYVAITAYDTATNPAPNESALSGAYLANPNTAPFDRTVHQFVGNFANSIAVMRDDFLVSTGVGPASSLTGAYGAVNQLPEGKFTVTAYGYQQYGAFNTYPGTVASTVGRQLVTDGNRIVYGFDPGNGNYNITPQPGLDVIEAGNLAVGPTLVNSSVLFSTYYIDHLVPAYRAGVGSGAQTTHGVMTFTTYAGPGLTNPTYWLQTFHLSATDHMTPVLDSDATQISPGYATLDMKTVGNYVFVLNESGIYVYTIGAAFPAGAIPQTTTMSAPYSSGTRSMAINWPYIYYSDGNNNTALSVTGVTSAVGAPITLAAPWTASTLGDDAVQLMLAGDLLLVQETPLWNATVMESFTLAYSQNAAYNSAFPSLNGNYDLNQGGELGLSGNANGDSCTGMGMGFSGSTVFILNVSNHTNAYTPLYYSTVDAVEMGGPRSINRQAEYVGLSDDSAPQELSQMLGTQIRGTRAIGLAIDGYANMSVINTGLVGAFSNAINDSYVSTTINVPTPPTYFDSTFCESPPCIPFKVAGDYAFVDKENAGTHSILVFDVSVPAKGFTYFTTLTATASPTGFAVAGNYLYVSESNFSTETAVSTPTWLERFDLTALGGTTPPTPVTANNGAGVATNGFSIDVYGDSAYVGIEGGYCIVNLLTYNSSSPPSTTCYTQSGWAVLAIAVDSQRLVYAGHSGSEVLLDYLSSPGNDVAAYPAPSSESPVGLFMNGPNLYQASQGLNDAFAGYDTSSTTDLPLGSDPFIRGASQGLMGQAGSLVVVPNASSGTVLERIY